MENSSSRLLRDRGLKRGRKRELENPHLFQSCLLYVYYVPGTIISNEQRVMNETDKILSSRISHFLWGRHHKQTTERHAVGSLYKGIK